MAYNNGFQMNYPQYYPQYQQAPQQQNNNGGLIWVSGEAGAKAYLVAPNNTVQLWDSENQTIYLKSADASGMPSMRILDYTIRSDAPKMPHNAFQANGPINICKDDLDSLQRQIDALKDELAQYKQSLIEKGASHGKSALSADE